MQWFAALSTLYLVFARFLIVMCLLGACDLLGAFLWTMKLVVNNLENIIDCQNFSLVICLLF